MRVLIAVLSILTLSACVGVTKREVVYVRAEPCRALSGDPACVPQPLSSGYAVPYGVPIGPMVPMMPMYGPPMLGPWGYPGSAVHIWGGPWGSGGSIQWRR